MQPPGKRTNGPKRIRPSPTHFAENEKGSFSWEPAAESQEKTLDQRIEPLPPRAVPQSTSIVVGWRYLALAKVIGLSPIPYFGLSQIRARSVKRE
jgi:hypothetical protein